MLQAEIPDESFARWNPDSNPQKYSTGIGHNILELAVRLRARNQQVTFGLDVPKDTDVVIFYKKHLLLERSRSLKILKIASKFPTVLVRSDLPIEHDLIFSPDLEVVPNRILVKTESQRYLPHLPQRGLITRDPTRGNEISNFEIKCYAENIPDNLSLIEEAISRVIPNMSLKVDSPVTTDSSDNRWHDFHHVDVSLILRPEKVGAIFSYDRKPATRLINAWVAGTIPFVDPLPAYLELIRDKMDGFIIHKPEDIETILRTLVNDPEYLAEVRRAVQKRGENFQVDRILDDWEAAIKEVIDKAKMGISRKVRLNISFLRFYSSFKVLEILNLMKKLYN